MNPTVLLIITLFAALLGGVLRKFYSKKNGLSIAGGFLFSAFSCLVAAVILLCSVKNPDVSLYTLLLGLLFGALTAVQSVTNLLALECGPMSYTTVLISFSTVISAFSGFFFFDEQLKWAQIVGIVLMIVCCALAVPKGESKKPMTVKWLLLCLIAFICTGCIGIMQKVHQNSAHKEEAGMFLIIAFFASALLSLIIAALFAKREKGQSKCGGKKAILLLLPLTVICGVCTAANNEINLYLSGVLESAFFFPVVNGGGLVLTTVAALLLFREKLSKKQWIGMAFGTLSVIMLCNPFG